MKSNHLNPSEFPHKKAISEMAVSVTHLFEASMNSHYSEVRRLGSHITKNLIELGFENEAKKISASLRKKGLPLQASGQFESLPVDSRSKLPLVEELPWPTTPIFMNESALEIFNRIILDTENASLLSEAGLSSKLCLLLVGPPGTGKTLLASHIASKLKRPFYVARLDSLISSLLGDTAKNIRSIFDFIPRKGAVLLLDEVDAIAKIRDDKYELGEIKRVVNTLIQGLDSIDDQTVVIGATNHSHLLDQAIWRRFPYKIELNNPDLDVREAMWRYFLFADKDEENTSKPLAILSEGFSGSEIQEISLRARRTSILQKKPIGIENIGRLILQHIQGGSVQASSSSHEDERRKLAVFMCVERGLTQVDAARILGLTRQTIHNYLKEIVHE